MNLSTVDAPAARDGLFVAIRCRKIVAQEINPPPAVESFADPRWPEEHRLRFEQGYQEGLIEGHYIQARALIQLLVEIQYPELAAEGFDFLYRYRVEELRGIFLERTKAPGALAAGRILKKSRHSKSN